MSLTFDTSYLNKTVNKSPRPAGKRYLTRVWHETAGYGSLDWNLVKYHIVNGKRVSSESSYDFLIKRNGTIFHYLDHKRFTSWDTGDSAWTIDGVRYEDWALNEVTLGIELEGPNDGTRCTPEQIESAAKLAVWLYETEGIPLTGDYDVSHKQIAPGRKSDPRGYTVAEVVERAQEIRWGPRWEQLWGDLDIPYHADHGIPARWRDEHAAGRALGKVLTHEFDDPTGVTFQRFARGLIGWTKMGGTVVYRMDEGKR